MTKRNSFLPSNHIYMVSSALLHHLMEAFTYVVNLLARQLGVHGEGKDLSRHLLGNGEIPPSMAEMSIGTGLMKRERVVDPRLNTPLLEFPPDRIPVGDPYDIQMIYVAPIRCLMGENNALLTKSA